MKSFNLAKLPRLIDISGVRTSVSLNQVDRIVDVAKLYQFCSVFVMPCFTDRVVELLSNEKDIKVGAVVGFPSGTETTSIKVAEAQEMIRLGVDELDMMINVAALKSGLFDRVRNDIKAVVDVAEGMPVKTILEVAYLSDDEIRRGCELAVEAGAAYIRTGSGWTDKPTTLGHIRLIKSTIGNAAKIKVAGGIRALDTIIAMEEAGCSRFGIGLEGSLKIIDEAAARMKSQGAAS